MKSVASYVRGICGFCDYATNSREEVSARLKAMGFVPSEEAAAGIFSAPSPLCVPLLTAHTYRCALVAVQRANGEEC